MKGSIIILAISHHVWTTGINGSLQDKRSKVRGIKITCEF